jgi:hypothetical protein
MKMRNQRALPKLEKRLEELREKHKDEIAAAAKRGNRIVFVESREIKQVPRKIQIIRHVPDWAYEEVRQEFELEFQARWDSLEQEYQDKLTEACREIREDLEEEYEDRLTEVRQEILEETRL